MTFIRDFLAYLDLHNQSRQRNHPQICLPHQSSYALLPPDHHPQKHQPLPGRARAIPHPIPHPNPSLQPHPQQLPINLRPHKASPRREPKRQNDAEKAHQDNRGIIHIPDRHGQLGREADENHDDGHEEWGESVADVAQAAEVEGAVGGERFAAAAEEEDGLRDGVGDVLGWVLAGAEVGGWVGGFRGAAWT